MQTIEDSVSIAANATNNNVLTGKLFEKVSNYPGVIIRLLHTGSAAGLVFQLLAGDKAITEVNPVNTQNRVPMDPDDQALRGVGVEGGKQLVLRVQNTTAGALTYRYRLEQEEARWG